jgi:iron complex transport system ATP-binding protein
MNNKHIEISNYSFSVGEKRILGNVSFSVEKGEYLSIIGPNGAGKSTLLKCIDRITDGGSGSIRIDDKPLDDYSQKELAKLVGYVPQAEGGSVPFTVREFVLMGRYPHLSPFTLPKKEDEEIVIAALKLTGSENLQHRMLNTLSGGERQNVLIAAALTQEAHILLLDEPTSFLDPRHCIDIHRRLHRINREWGVTILSVTHDINSAVLMSNRILALKEGGVVYTGPADDIMNNEVLKKIYDTEFLFATHPQTGKPVIVEEEVRL